LILRLIFHNPTRKRHKFCNTPNEPFNTALYKPIEWISTPKSMKNPENLHRKPQIKEYLFKICWKIYEPVHNGNLSTTENCPGTDDSVVDRFYCIHHHRFQPFSSSFQFPINFFLCTKLALFFISNSLYIHIIYIYIKY
jgi:hypothetical protein